MSRLIRITEETIQQIQQDFIESLRKLKMPGGKISYSKEFGKVDRKAELVFSEKAWLKQEALVREFSSEVGWHGIAFRGEDPEKDEYYIKDIIVYPQEISRVTVTTDQDEYQMWLMQQEDDVFNNIRMQGHSHVDMSVTPSGVDDSLYERILDQLDETMFYIFLIWNKRGARTIKIYDLQKNILFETEDVEVFIEGGYDIDEFIQDAKNKAKTKVTTYGTAYGGNYVNGVYQGNRTQNTPAANTAKPVTPSKPSTTPTTDKKGKKKKGRKDSGPVSSISGYGDQYDDDYYMRKFGLQ